jgi:small conductance mechanosensitive channel
MIVPFVGAIQGMPEFITRIAALLQVDPGVVLSRMMAIGVIWALAWCGDWLIRLLARRIERAVDDGDDTTMTMHEKQGRTVAQLLRSIGRLLIIALALLMTLNQFINIAPILAGAGILGLAVSFGAQSLVKDFITGFFMLVENSLAVGDTVEIAGKTGTVERITLRVVRLRDVDGTLHVIPNGQITTVSNQTRGWSRAVVDVTVGYESDLDRALQVFREVAADFARDALWSRLLDGPPEVLGVQQLAERGITLRTLLRTLPGKQWEVAREFRLRILDSLAHARISIAALPHVAAMGQGTTRPEPEAVVVVSSDPS